MYNMDEKITLRQKFKEIRKTLDMHKKSLELCRKLRQLDIYKNANKILIYFPLPDEVNPLLLMSDKKKFYLPRVDGESLLICPYKLGDELKVSNLKIREPLTNSTKPNILDLIVVPALAVDDENYRLGYGGGFYDKFIEQNSQIKTVTLIPKELTIKKLPHENFDKKIDIIIAC